MYLHTIKKIFKNSVISANNSHLLFQCFTVNGQDLTTTTASATTMTTQIATSTTGN
jgi:hypothetical protein